MSVSFCMCKVSRCDFVHTQHEKRGRRGDYLGDYAGRPRVGCIVLMGVAQVIGNDVAVFLNRHGGDFSQEGLAFAPCSL